jgi:hypothetical protein
MAKMPSQSTILLQDDQWGERRWEEEEEEGIKPAKNINGYI